MHLNVLEDRSKDFKVKIKASTLKVNGTKFCLQGGLDDENSRYTSLVSRMMVYGVASADRWSLRRAARDSDPVVSHVWRLETVPTVKGGH